MADKNTIISIKNQNAVVPQNTDYLLEFSIKAPYNETEKTTSNLVNGINIGKGKMFSLTIDASNWQSINKIEVK